MIANREIRFDNRFNTKAKRLRNDWKAKRKDRHQYIFDGGEVTNGFDKRKSAFMTEDEEEYERWERERYCYEI